MKRKSRWLACLLTGVMAISSASPALAQNQEVEIKLEQEEKGSALAEAEQQEVLSEGEAELAEKNEKEDLEAPEEGAYIGKNTEQDPKASLMADFTFDEEADQGGYLGGTAKAQGSYQVRDHGDGKAVYLNGSNQFLNVTNQEGESLLTGMETMTISYDAKPENGKNWSFFAAPNEDRQVYQQEKYLGILHNTTQINVERYNNNGVRPGNNLASEATGNWSHVDLVVTENHTKLYVNGELKSESDSTYAMGELLGMESVLQIGKGNWENGEYYKGWLDNYRIYEGALSEEEIGIQYEGFLNESLWNGVSLPTQPIQKDLQLPKVNEAGDSITWTSQNQEVLSGEGVIVNRPQENTAVVLTARIGEVEKNFTVTVAGVSELLQEAYDSLALKDTDDVRGNLPLLKEGSNGSSINWISGNPEIITDTADESSPYDGGMVTRPEEGKGPVQVELQAEISLWGISKTKTFIVTVQPMPGNLDREYTGGYLWTNFGTEGGYEKIFMGYSEDGLTWEKLNKNSWGTPQPILAADKLAGSDLGVRDPHLIRSPQGDKYWILGTDLHAEGGGAGGSGWNQLSASQNILVWESDDLVNWSEPRLVFAGFESAGCVWAPEAIYDEALGDYLVYWSSRDNTKASTDENALRVYVCRTRDFSTFTKPKLWLSEDQDSGKEVNVIDSTIVEDQGKFYRFSTSDWNTVLDVSDTLDTEDTLDVRNGESQSAPRGAWKRLVARGQSQEAGFDGREGLTVYQLPGGEWCVMGDNGGYKAFVTDDLSSGKFTAVNSSFVDGKFRHGTVVRLSKAEEARILEAYGPQKEEEEVTAQAPVLEYSFEGDLNKAVMTDTGTGNKKDDSGTLKGNARILYDDERKGNVLTLDGTSGAYGEFPQGFFDKRDTMTISMYVKSEMSSGAFFTFAYGLDNSKYNFLRIRGNTVRNAITVNSYTAEQQVASSDGADTGEWQKVDIVVDGTNMKLYIDGALTDENTDTGIQTSHLGTGLLAYLGKSFYNDPYFKGSFDNIKIYNRALSEAEILSDIPAEAKLLRKITVGSVPEDPANTMGTDSHTAVSAKVDKDKKIITSYVKKDGDLTNIPVSFKVLGSTLVKVEGEVFINGSDLDLSKDLTVTLTLEDRVETWILKKPSLAGNPVLPGQYADPDIDYFDGKYWIYPTTDGYSGWGGTVFHAFSSDNLVDWRDEGVILDVKEKNPGTNDKGIQIASSSWSDGNAWAPSIEEKNGKYYFYYCGNINSSNTGLYGSGKAIGVAVADRPEGPYVAQDAPIVYPKMCSQANIGFSGQVIDPSIFTEDDGSSYLLFGNGSAAIAQLNEDMTTIKSGSMRKLNGLKDFRESVVITKRNGIYHYTWSCDDTGSPNYRVNYGTADSLTGNITFRYTLIQKDESKDMLGTAHQSVVYDPKTDKCYLAYHRFYTPLGLYSDGYGYHRETCIDEITFDEHGLMKPMVPTMEGVGAKEPVPTPTVTPLPTETPKPSPTPVTVAKTTGVQLSSTVSTVKVTWKKQAGVTGYEVYRYNSTAKKYSKLTATKATSYTDKSRKSATGYRYAVRAYKKVNGKTFYGSYSGGFQILTKPGTPASVKGKRTTKAGTRTTAVISFQKVERATAYRIYKYNTSKKSYEMAFKIENNRLYRYDVKKKKYSRVNSVSVKGGIITCTLTNLNLKKEKSQKYLVKSAVSRKGYTTQYSASSKTVTIK